MDELEGWDFVLDCTRRSGNDAARAAAQADSHQQQASSSTREVGGASASDGDESRAMVSSVTSSSSPYLSRLHQIDLGSHRFRERLEVTGYTVFDNAAGEAYSDGVLAEIVSLHADR
jgi:hypothetical protein